MSWSGGHYENKGNFQRNIAFQTVCKNRSMPDWEEVGVTQQNLSALFLEYFMRSRSYIRQHTTPAPYPPRPNPHRRTNTEV